MARKKKFPEGKPMLDVGALNDLNPKNGDFVREISSLVNANEALLVSPQLRSYVLLALYQAKANEDVASVAKKLTDELAGYSVRNNFQVPAGVRKLQAALKEYY